ncbi:MAG: hypothetical protein RLY35_1968 [Bacteroidota bacterium]|jgi:predicted glycosyltransferase
MKRRLLFDLGHPGHFHLFKKSIFYFSQHPDYKVFVTTRNVPMILSLLQSANLDYTVIGSKRNGILGKLWSVIETDFSMLFFVLKNKINLGLHCGIVLSHVSLVTRMRSWIFDDDDDEVEPLMVNFSHPFSEAVFTPDCIRRKTKKAIYYPGTHELSYLYDDLNFAPGSAEKYSIVRLVAFAGHHDTGHLGLNKDQIRSLIDLLERYGRVFITSEKPLAGDWEKYRMAIEPHQMHEFMTQALVVVGDSQTMISEAATIGVPAFKCNSFAGILSVPNMLEREFGLCFSFDPNQFEEMLSSLSTVLSDQNVISTFRMKRNKFLREKVSTSKLMIQLIEKWELDFNELSCYKREDWLSLASKNLSCEEISR